MIGKYFALGKDLSPAQYHMLLKILQQLSLNKYTKPEQQYLYCILKHLFAFCLNVYILKESLCHVGTRDDIVLSRKVPGEFWSLFYEACIEMKVTNDMLISESRRAALWLHFNRNPELLQGLTNLILNKLGIYEHVQVDSAVITDGNYIFNLGSALPSRILMLLCYCLTFWGQQQQEPWVSFFSGKFFILFLILSGVILPQKNWVNASSQMGFLGFIEIIISDLQATLGITGNSSQLLYDESLDYLFTFNNNVQY